MAQAKWHKPEDSLLFEGLFSFLTSSPPALPISGQSAGSSVPVRERQSGKEH